MIRLDPESVVAKNVSFFKKGVLLLERAVSGNLLKNSLPKKKRIEIACKVIDKLHQAPIPSKEGFPAIEEWLAAVDKEWDLPKDHLKRARKLIRSNSSILGIFVETTPKSFKDLEKR